MTSSARWGVGTGPGAGKRQGKREKGDGKKGTDLFSMNVES